MRHADLDRLYEVVKNMEWHLEHTPEHPVAENVDGTYWLIESAVFPGQSGAGIPGVTLMYRFDDEAVYIRDIRVIPPPDIQYAGS